MGINPPKLNLIPILKVEHLRMGIYKKILRPILFRLSAERAHELSIWGFKQNFIWNLIETFVEDKRLETGLGGMKLSNPVGLAAGYDKNCEIVRAITRLGFGYIVVGSVTYHPREGNPKPRIVRRIDSCSIINSMGLPGKGVVKCVENLEKIRNRKIPLLVSIAGFSVDEYIECYRLLEPYVDGVEINVSCPNVREGKMCENFSIFRKLITELNKYKKKPIFVKISPYQNEKEREDRLELVNLCVKQNIDGITAINTKKVDEPELYSKAGGLSGKSIRKDMLRIVSDVYRETRGKIAINACGGIFSGLDAFNAIKAGASTVQIYTSLVYEGWDAPRNIAVELLRLICKSDVQSLLEIKGTVYYTV